MKRILINLSALLILLAILSGCSNSNGATEGQATPDTGDMVRVLFDSGLYAYGDQLLKTKLFSYQDEIYAPLQGIFEAKYQTFMWDKATQTATVTHNSEITPQLEAIAEHWAYPSIGRGSYRAEYVRILEYDANNATFTCEGRDIYTFRLTSERQEQYSQQLSERQLAVLHEVLSQSLASGKVLKLVSYFPWPLMAGPLPPEVLDEILAPVFVELSYPYTEERQAIIRPITINAEDNGEPLIMNMKALEYEGLLYISVTALDNELHWFWFGSIETD